MLNAISRPRSLHVKMAGLHGASVREGGLFPKADSVGSRPS